MNREKSDALFKRAISLIPAGVNSPVRAFKSVNDSPFYVKRQRAPTCTMLMEMNTLIMYHHGEP